MVAFSRFAHKMDGAVFVFFVITVAAAEVAVGLALIVALYRRRGTIQSDALNLLRD
jgi:NADH-quinone oxidoreductase subunit K